MRTFPFSLACLVALVMADPPAAQSQTAAAPAASAARTVELKSSDGLALKASYYSPGRPGPGLLLFHACNSDRSSWNGLAVAAAERGFHVLAMDYRGYGQSGGTRANDPAQQRWIADRE